MVSLAPNRGLRGWLTVRSSAVGARSSGTIDAGYGTAGGGLPDRSRDGFQKGRTQSADRCGGLEIEGLVEIDSIVLVEDHPAGKVEAGAAALHRADGKAHT